MASLGHVAVGLAAARARRARHDATMLTAAMVGWAALSMLPDADVMAFALGVPYDSPFGHRGFTHSLAFAAVCGVVAWLLARRSAGAWRTAACAALVVASHPLLDMLTDGGRGVALLWPFTAERFFAPWNPIPVSPIGFNYLSARGLHVAASELLLFLPVLLYALWPRRAREPLPWS